MWSADDIAELCYKHYSTKLPKRGMPDPKREWTLLAAVVQVVSQPDSDPITAPQPVPIEVVAMGTGTKCIGQSKMSIGGDALNDSHAEIIAKRSFQRYLLHQFSLATSHTQDSIFIQGTEKGKWRLKPEISFIFFSSHTPCGDASIIPMIEQEDQPCQAITSKKLLKQGKATHENIGRVTSVCNKRELQDMTHGGSSKRVRRYGDDSSAKIEWEPAVMKEAAIFLPLSSDRNYHKLPGTGEGANVRTWGAHLGQESTMVVADEGADTLHSIPDVAVEFVPPSLREEATPAPRITSEGNLHLVTIRERVNCSSGEQLTLACSAPQISLNAAECFTTGFACGAKVVDIYRTGAKCVPGELQDNLDPGLDYHLVGLLRVKPGRGDRTCSMSCSDKMARWNVLGCQGALLMHFLLQPLYFSAFVIGKCPYSQDAMERALITRCQHIQSLPDGFNVQEVLILQSGLQFPHSRLAVIPVHDASKGKLVPSGAGDSGYPNLSWLLTPVRNPRTRAEERYSEAHGHTRRIIERTFGLLKARFCCIHMTGGSLYYSPKKVCQITVACCMLHNLALRRPVPFLQEDEAGDGRVAVVDPVDSEDEEDEYNRTAIIRQYFQ